MAAYVILLPPLGGVFSSFTRHTNTTFECTEMSSSNQGHGLPRLQSPEVNATLPAPIYDKMQVTASSLSRVPPMPSALFASMLDDDDEDDEGSRSGCTPSLAPSR